MCRILNGTSHQIVVYDRNDLVRGRSRNYLEKKNHLVEPVWTVDSSFDAALGVEEIVVGAGIQTDVGLTLKEPLANNGCIKMMPSNEINFSEDIIIVSSMFADVATRVCNPQIADILFVVGEKVKEQTKSGWEVVGCTSIRKANPFYSIFFYIADTANLMTKRLAYEYFKRNENYLQMNEKEALRTLEFQIRQLNEQKDVWPCF